MRSSNIHVSVTRRYSIVQLSINEVRLKAVEEERDTIKEDLEGSDRGKDEVIRKAWETRDAAVKRKNAAEVELARERIAVMQVNDTE